MKILSIIIAAFVSLNTVLAATEKVQMIIVTVPGGSEVKYAKRAYVGRDIINAPHRFGFYSMQYLVRAVEHDSAQDINLISAYGIVISSRGDKGVLVVDVLTKIARKPKGHRFSVLQVARMAAKAVRGDHQDRSKVIIKINGEPIKEAEQGAASDR